MSRIFMSAKHAPLLAFQASPDFADWMRQTLLELFGVKILSAEFVGENGTYYWDFEGNEEECEEFVSILQSLYKSRPEATRDVDIDLNFN